jgi:hypothetical protein
MLGLFGVHLSTRRAEKKRNFEILGDFDRSVNIPEKVTDFVLPRHFLLVDVRTIAENRRTSFRL